MSRYKFITGCPACGSKEKYQWVHKNCSSYEEIDEDGDIYCLGCNKRLGFIMDLEYNCCHQSHQNYQTPKSALKNFQALTLLSDVQDMPENKRLKLSERVIARAKTNLNKWRYYINNNLYK